MTQADVLDIHDEGAPSSQGVVNVVEGRTPMQLAWRRLRKDRVSLLSMATIGLFIIMAIFAPVWTALIGHGPNQQFPETGLSPSGVPVGPNGTFLLGTDELGRDVLSRIIYGSRISLGIGIGATAVALVIGIAIGVAAGFYGGRIDQFLARFMDVILSFPSLLLAIALVARYGASFQLTLIIIAFFSWPAIGRLVRGQVLVIKEREYIEAARSLGSSNLRIMVFDVLPNLIALSVVYATLLIPVNIVTESVLSFLGLGILPPTASWGNMISDSQNGELYQIAPWFLIFPSLALFLITLSFNLLGDGLRDALDPRSGRSQLGGK